MALYLDDNQWPQGLLQQVKERKSFLLHIENAFNCYVYNCCLQ